MMFQKLQLLPAVYCSEIPHTMDRCSQNQIAVVGLYFHCGLTAKVSSVATILSLVLPCQIDLISILFTQ